MLNAANGNCLWDSIINNILGRGCYKKKLSENSKQLRVNAMFIYMADFMAQEMVPDTYDYTCCPCLCKGKSNKLDLNMTRYIHSKEWDAKFLEALVSE